jgi:GH15 family glucan-1,4-alpha-glucosidase
MDRGGAFEQTGGTFSDRDDVARPVRAGMRLDQTSWSAAGQSLEVNGFQIAHVAGLFTRLAAAASDTSLSAQPALRSASDELSDRDESLMNNPGWTIILSSMPRDLPIGNGSLLINFDQDYNIRDVYYPHVGQDNQTVGDVSFFGVWCDNVFAWIGNPAWRKTLEYEGDTLVTRVVATSDSMGLEMTISDTVDFDRPLFVRRVVLRNLRNVERKARLYLHFDPHLWGNNIGDTIFYEPEYGSLVAYKGRRYVLMNASIDDTFGFKAFAIGAKEREGFQGTWRDAEDGNLQQNAIAQGSVDATGMVELNLPAEGEGTAFFWWAFGKSYREVSVLETMVRERGAIAFLDRTRDYWRLWVKSDCGTDLSVLPPAVQKLYRRSLLIMRTQIDDDGAVIAATDSDIVQFGRDTYTYMWPRDGAIVTTALTQAGYPEITRRFFEFCSKLVTGEGFLLHKYNPDGSVGSSWHPWMSADGQRQLPIQEDETALVVWALWAHFERFHDVEFIRPLYKPFVKQTADFMARYREPHTRLPAPSHDLWEERRGILSYTAATVWAGLMAAAKFAEAFGDIAVATKYRTAAGEIKAATIRHLYSAELGRFYRMINVSRDGRTEADATMDSSMSGLWLYGMFEVDDPKIVSTMEQIIARLTVKTAVGGMARYENDYYHQVEKNDLVNVPGNPWILCSQTVAQWHAARAKTTSDLEPAIAVLNWTTERALSSGVLAEQVHPYNGTPLSVSPLTWSHASFVLTAYRVAERLNALTKKERSGADRRDKRGGPA